MLQAALIRLREPSTYAGLGIILGLFGINVAPEVIQPFVQAATGAAALVAILLREGR